MISSHFYVSKHKKICSYQNKKDISKLPRVKSSDILATMPNPMYAENTLISS